MLSTSKKASGISRIILSNLKSTRMYKNSCAACTKALDQSIAPFANCHHLNLCMICGQTYLLDRIDNKIFPHCIECQAEMITKEQQKCLFEYFSTDVKKRFAEFLKQKDFKNESPFQIKVSCSQINCSGIRKNHKCLKCKTVYCERCGELDHPIGQQCVVKAPNLIEGCKQCPKCYVNYVKDSGCNHIICSNCKHSFCHVCSEPWNRLHHGCGIFNQLSNSNMSTAPPQSPGKPKSSDKVSNCCKII